MSTIAQDEHVTRVRRDISDIDRQLVELVNKRLKLVASAKTILAATLDLIGVSAPEEM